MAQLIHGTTIANHIAIHAGNMADHGIATTSYVTTQINNLIDGAPGALDTLNELAAALGDNANFATSVTDSIAGKLSNDADSEQDVGGRYFRFNNGGNRINIDPRWNESGYDADMGVFHMYSTTAAGAQWGRTGLALYTGSAYQYLTTKANTTGIFLNDREILTTGNIGSYALTSYSETDPTVPAHVKSITTTEKSNWNTAYGWGNHASAGYLTSLPSHNHDGVYVNSYTTSAGDIDGDWGQSFKTFDPVPSGTPPIASPNLRTINVGNDFNRRTQLAFTYATDQAWFRRRNESGWQVWREFIHSGNIGSQSVSSAASAGNADTVDGYHATNAAGGLAVINANGYWYAPSWINVGSTGIFSSTNNAHILPNVNSPHGAWEMIGSRGGWSAIYFRDSGNTLMANSNNSGFYNVNAGWQIEWYNGTLSISKQANGGGTLATVLDSVNYTSYAAAAGHTHDDRYYTESESDSRFVNASGDSMSGSLTLDAGAALVGTHGDWTGEQNKIQWHSTHLYLQNRGGGNFFFRRSDGTNVFNLDNNGSLIISGDFYPNGQGTYRLYVANSGLWTNGNFGAEGDLYLGTRGVWLSSWLNQSIQTGASPTFNNVFANGIVGNNASQTRDKLRVWTGGEYTIGMKNGYSFGHIGSGEYAMSFMMNNNSSRGFWWGDTAHSDAQGAAALTTDGRMNIAKSLSIGEGETITSPSSTPLYVRGQVDGADVLAVDGINGRLFTVTDDLTDSLFSVNTIAGLPVIEAFANNIVNIGPYTAPVVFSASGISTPSHGTSANWLTAYNKRPTGVAFSGSSTKTLTLTLGDGSTLTAAFNDIDTDTNTDGQTLSISGSTLTISGGNSVTIPSGGISQATADGLYQPLENQRLSTGNGPTFTNIYNNGWFRNNNNNEGLYNQNQDRHFYNLSGNWRANIGGHGGGLIIENGHNSAALMYVGYHDANGRGVLMGSSWWLNSPAANPLFLTIGGHENLNAHTSAPGIRLMFGGGNTDAQDNYYIGTNMENYGGNHTKLDLRWHTGIRMGAQASYGGIRFFNSEDLGSRIMSIGESDANVRIDNNLWIGGAGGWLTDLLAGKQAAGSYAAASHTHDDRYYTESESDSRYILKGTQISSSASWPTATRFGSVGDLSQDAGNHALSVRSEDGNDAFMSFHIGNDYAVHFGLERSSNRMHVGGWSETGSRYQLWDSRDFSSTNISNWNTAYGWGNHASLYASSSHTHDDRYYTETEIDNFSFFRDNQDRTLSVLRFTGVGGDSGNANHGYAIYQGGGSWSHPYPDLHIGYHTGIKLGANTGYGGIRFYSDSNMATELFSVGNGDSNVRVAYNLYIGSAGGWLTDLLAGKQAAGSYAAASHTHDDRYYTEGEADGRYLYYRGMNQETDFQRFVNTPGVVRFDQANATGGFSNAPGGYTYGGVLSLRGVNFGFQLWGSHTGDLFYKTQWENDNYTGWRSIITALNIGSQTVSNSDMVDGYHVSVAGAANTIPTRNGSGYLIPENWIQLNGHYGLYSGTNNAHFYPNNYSYGSWKSVGERNGWKGIHFGQGTGMTLMMNETEFGFHREAHGWYARFTNGHFHGYADSAGSVPWTGVTGRPTALSQFSNDSGFITSGSTVAGLTTTFLGNDSTNIGSGYSRVIRNENGNGGNPTYAPVLHLAASDTMWQISAGHGGQTNLVWRSGYAGTWYTWHTILHSGNYTSFAPSLGGSGASGTWSINISGTAARATRANGNFYIDDNYGNTVVGVYESTRLQGVWAMGDAYKLAADGTSASNHYGIAWSHPNHGGEAANLSDHGMLIQIAGRTKTAISTSIWCIGDIIAFSDARVKANVAVIDNPLERLSKVRGVTFTRTDLEDPTKRYTGVIAQEMREALPEAVSENANGELSVSYGNTVGLLIESIKAQQAQIEELKAEVKKLKGE